MLVFSRKQGETFMIGDGIRVTVTRIMAGHVELKITSINEPPPTINKKKLLSLKKLVKRRRE